MYFILAFSVIFPVLYALQNHFHLKELHITETHRTEKAIKYNKKWHLFQGAIQILVAALIGVMNWKLIFVFVALFWLIFDLTLNILSGRKALYLGTNLIDNILKKLGFFHIILKLIFVVASLLVAFL